MNGNGPWLYLVSNDGYRPNNQNRVHGECYRRMNGRHEDHGEQAYSAFKKRDIDSALAPITLGVSWPSVSEDEDPDPAAYRHSPSCPAQFYLPASFCAAQLCNVN